MEPVMGLVAIVAIVLLSFAYGRGTADSSDLARFGWERRDEQADPRPGWAGWE